MTYGRCDGTAWAHGFVSMELAGGFRLGGDLERAYDFGIERLAAALAASTAPGPPEGARPIG